MIGGRAGARKLTAFPRPVGEPGHLRPLVRQGSAGPRGDLGPGRNRQSPGDPARRAMATIERTDGRIQRAHGGKSRGPACCVIARADGSAAFPAARIAQRCIGCVDRTGPGDARGHSGRYLGTLRRTSGAGVGAFRFVVEWCGTGTTDGVEPVPVAATSKLRMAR
jgi:hypothetical protein